MTDSPPFFRSFSQAPHAEEIILPAPEHSYHAIEREQHVGGGGLQTILPCWVSPKAARRVSPDRGWLSQIRCQAKVGNRFRIEILIIRHLAQNPLSQRYRGCIILQVKLHRRLRCEQFVRQQERDGNDPSNAEFLGPVPAVRGNLSPAMFRGVNAERQHQMLIAESAHFVSRHVDFNCPFEKIVDLESD